MVSAYAAITEGVVPMRRYRSYHSSVIYIATNLVLLRIYLVPYLDVIQVYYSEDAADNVISQATVNGKRLFSKPSMYQHALVNVQWYSFQTWICFIVNKYFNKMNGHMTFSYITKGFVLTLWNTIVASVSIFWVINNFDIIH